MTETQASKPSQPTNANPYTHAVEYDLEYLEGALSGIQIPISVPCVSLKDATRRQRFFNKVYQENDFVRAIGTGKKYKVTTHAAIVTVNPIS